MSSRARAPKGSAGRVRPCFVVLAAAGTALGAAPTTLASNENRPRTPVGFPESPCLEILDRSDPAAALRIDLAIPYEDTALTADELPDSRTLQFFATCEDLTPGTRLPGWISLEDAERALAVGALEALPDDSDVLERGPWSSYPGHDGLAGSCVVPVTPADARLPIDCDATLEALEWRAEDVPAGAYVIHGYTFEPSTNIWSRRAGVVQVHDGDPAAAGPAAAVVTPARDSRAYPGSPYPIQGCATGVPGTVLRLSWAPTTAPDHGDPAAWRPIAELTVDAPDSVESFEFPFDPPPEAVGQAVLFRVEAQDPDGRSFTHHTRALLIVLDRDEESDPARPAAVPDACRDPAEPEPDPDPDGGTDTGGDTDAAAAGDEAKGCACDVRSPVHGPGGGAGLALLGMFWSIRRRQANSRRTRRPC